MNKNSKEQKQQSETEENEGVMTCIKEVEISKDSNLVFFGTCHCSLGGGEPD